MQLDGLLHRTAGLPIATAQHLRARRGLRPPERTTLLDDIADRRPWNVAVRCGRLYARHRQRSGPATVVIVTWNTCRVTADVLDAVATRSPMETPVLVVDNGSTDGTREMLAERSSVDVLRLPRNIGHGAALDLAMCRVRSRLAVLLDSDAFPVEADWLDVVLSPLETPGVVACGSRSSRNFVHPMFMAIDVEEILKRKLSFRPHRLPNAGEVLRWGIDTFDTAEWLSRCLSPAEKAFIERTPNKAPDLPGMTAGGVVYHHGGVSRGVSPDESWIEAQAALGAR